jgi:hypothetical protein
VVWARVINEGPDKQAGMGIRFLEITPDGRELIYQMVDNYIAQGGTPFDVTDMPKASPAPPETESPSPQPKPAATTATVSQVEATLREDFGIPAVPAVPAVPAGVVERPYEPGDLIPSLPVESTPAWLPALAAPTFGLPPEHTPAPTAPEISPVMEEEVSTRRSSRLFIWAVVGGVLVLAVALAIFNQEALLGWFLPKGVPTAAVASQSGSPLQRKVNPPGALLPVPSAASASSSAASPASPTSPAPIPAGAGPSQAAAPTARPAASSGTAVSTPDAILPPSPPPPQSVQALPAGAGPGEIQKITWKQNPDGTEVILWADGAIRRQDWSHYRIDGDSPRELVKLYGIRHPFPSPRLVAGTQQLLQVRTGYHDGPKGNELHVVLDLSGSGVEVIGIEAQGEQLHVRLKGK